MKVCPTCNREFMDGASCPRDGTPLVRKQTDPLLGRLIKKRYLLESRVGLGGMGAVYKATDKQADRTVAVKVLLTRAGPQAAEHAARFMREAEMLEKLNHPNIVTLLDHGRESDGVQFIVMEYLVGKTLQEVVEEPVAVETAVAVLEEVVSALAAAHAQRLVHRDMKPDNIFIARQPDGSAVVKVIDFGLARAMEDDDGTALTLTGKVVGSAGFIAPEHIMGGRNFTAQSDVYGLGAVLFFMLTGRKPYAGESVASIMQQQVSEKPPTLGVAAGHPAAPLDPVVRRAMSRSVEKRYPTVQAFMKAVKVATGQSRPGPRTLVLSGLTVVRQAIRTGARAWEPVLALMVGVVAGLAVVGGIYVLLR